MPQLTSLRGTLSARRVLAWAASQRVQGALLMLGGALLTVGSAFRAEQTSSTPSPKLYPYDAVARDPHHGKRLAWTDRGTPVLLLAINPNEPANAPLEPVLLEAHDVAFRVIRTGASGGPNCHGWVYGQGRFLIFSDDVDTILCDNGYRVVTRPQAGDLVVYRDEQGSVCHSAVVCDVYETGMVLLESKWGHLGRYLHRPEDYPYSRAWDYYRSNREGHALLGLDGSQDKEAGTPFAWAE